MYSALSCKILGCAMDDLMQQRAAIVELNSLTDQAQDLWTGGARGKNFSCLVGLDS